MTTLIGLAFAMVHFFCQEVPFKPQTDFEIKFDMSFKQRDQTGEKTTINLHETQAEHARRTQTTTLPFLTLHIKLVKVPSNEVKAKIIRDNLTVVYNKKIAEGSLIDLEVGFTDDIKDQIKGYRHEIQFLAADKTIQSKILIEFDEEGNYFVNGEKRGKV